MDVVNSRLSTGLKVENVARSHMWYADAPTEDNGEDSAPTPEELLLGALGACLSMTGKMYANRKGWQVESIEVKLELERIEPKDYPGCAGEAKFAHRIRETITITGALDDEQRSRILEIMRKCPVRRVVENPVVFEENMTAPEGKLA